jgi:sugar phosphate permease
METTGRRRRGGNIMSLIDRASVTDEARWRVYNRIAWKILPLMLIGYTIASIDRVNVAFAKLQMSAAIGLTEAMYGFGAGIFFIGYCLVEIPSNMILHRVGARLWLARIMIVWGVLIGVATALVQTPAHFYIVRFILGIAEAGYYPGALLFLTYWFPSNLRAQAISVMVLGSSFASIIGSPAVGRRHGLHERVGRSVGLAVGVRGRRPAGHDPRHRRLRRAAQQSGRRQMAERQR